MESARLAMRDIIRHDLSKYNHAPHASEWIWGDIPAPRVLVLDQTEGDASVSLGGADETVFRTMLNEVLRTYPFTHVRVKTHPDVIAGKKRGYLADYAAGRGVRVMAADCAPLSLLAGADVVYTVTSQMGFEALMLGKEVHCFGMPFYAGWGLTRDRQTCSRRQRRLRHDQSGCAEGRSAGQAGRLHHLQAAPGCGKREPTGRDARCGSSASCGYHPARLPYGASSAAGPRGPYPDFPDRF